MHVYPTHPPTPKLSSRSFLDFTSSECGSPQKHIYSYMADECLSSSSSSSSSNPVAAANSNLKIRVQSNPPDSQLLQLGIKSWPKWGCSPGKYDLKFEAEMTCYLVRGKVRVYPKNIHPPTAVEFGAGDLVVIPKGITCTWDISLPVDKHYKFHSS